MIKVSLQELKRKLSRVVREAAAGELIVITSHNKPVAKLGPADSFHLHHGAKFGRGRLKPLLKAKTKGRYLKALAEDRREDRPSVQE